MTSDHEVLRNYRRVAATIQFVEARRHMTTTTHDQAARDYRRVETAIRFLEAHAHEQPSLGVVARAVGLSDFHFQRLFRRWAGVSPKRFLQHLTVARAKEALRDGHSALGAAYEAGLSGPGRLHDLFVAVEAVTPGEFKQRGQDLTIRYGFQPSPFGESFLAVTQRGICALEFVSDAARESVVRRLRAAWPAATLREDRGAAAASAERAFAPVTRRHDPLPLLLRGTNFQLQVWQALLRVPPGALVTYGGIAQAIGRPGSERAVGRALGQNPIAYLIPCHRVIRSTGAFGGYHWGAERKLAIVGRELAAAG